MKSKHIWIWPIVAAIITTLDLLSKAAVRSALIQGRPKEILGSFFRFTLTYNYGITFGMFNRGPHGTPPIALIFTALIALGVVLYFFMNVNRFVKDGRPQFWARLALTFITGGAFGNIIDRFFHGRVTDFLDMGFGNMRWYTYNVADSFVVVGSIILAVLMVFFEKKEQKEAKK